MNCSRRQFHSLLVGIFSSAILPKITQADKIDNIQSVTIQSTFNLEQVFEHGQLYCYEYQYTPTYKISIKYISGRNENYISSPKSQLQYIKNDIQRHIPIINNNTLIYPISDDYLVILNGLVRVKCFDE